MDSRLLFNVRLWPLARRGGRHFHLLVMAIQPGGGGYVLYSRTPLFHCVPVLLLHCNSLGGGGGVGVCSRREKPSVSPSNGPALMGEVTAEDALHPPR